MQIPTALAHRQLSDHPEGGWYREVHRSPALTVIDYALAAGGFSAWHRVHESDEVWVHQQGGALAVMTFDGTTLAETVLGRDEHQMVVPAGVWQAARALDDTWVLAGCTVAPPFAFERFEMATPEFLVEHPRFADELAPWMPR